jgi:hypothetical protein
MVRGGAGDNRSKGWGKKIPKERNAESKRREVN